VSAQWVGSDLAALRGKAIAEKWVAVTVTTAATYDSRSTAAGTTTTVQQRFPDRIQQKLVMKLVSRDLVVGNEVSILSDRSLTMRALPAGLDFLAQSRDVSDIRATSDASRIQR